MTYIDLTSNYEKIHIWANSRGFVEIYQNRSLIYQNRSLNGQIPINLFNKIIDKYVDSEIKDIIIEDKQKKVHIKNILLDENILGNRLEWGRLGYDGYDYYIDMCNTTWEYIVRANYGKTKSKIRKWLIKKICKI